MKGGAVMMLDDQQFGMQLRAIRTGRGLSQVELATDLDLSPGRVSELESGKRDLTVTTLRRIAERLGVEPARLLEGDGESRSG